MRDVNDMTQPTPSEQALQFLQALPPGPQPWERDIDEMRAAARTIAERVRGMPEIVATAESLEVGGVPIRLYRPSGGERAAVVWFHGGGWMVSDVDCDDHVARSLANAAGCAVVAVDYRLVPENRYPAPFDDAWVATQWAVEHFDRVAVGGESAGGNLAAAVALRARDESIDLVMQLLVYPMLDAAAVDGPFFIDYSTRYDTFMGGTGVGAALREAFRWTWQEYSPDPSRLFEPYASPLQAHSLRDVAPAYVITAEHDILRGEAEQYASRLTADGVSVEIVDYPGQVHGFFIATGLIQDARDAVERSAAALKGAFGHQAL